MVEVVVADVAGEGRLFDLLSMLGFRQYESALWSGKGLVSARCHRVRSFMQGILKLGACYECLDMRCIKTKSGFMFLKCFIYLFDDFGCTMDVAFMVYESRM